MKKFLIFFICLLILILNLSYITSNKSKGKKLSKKNFNLNSITSTRPDPSGEPLPKFWTTGSRPNFPIQMNKKYKKYHTRLASSYRYKDFTKDLLKKPLRTSNKKTKVIKKKHNKKKHH